MLKKYIKTYKKTLINEQLCYLFLILISSDYFRIGFVYCYPIFLIGVILIHREDYKTYKVIHKYMIQLENK